MNAKKQHETKNETLARIDREILELLKLGKLSPLDYELDFPPEAKTDRRKNLKALLEARRYWRDNDA